MKEIKSDKTTITVSEETSAMVKAIASLDNVFNFASQKAEEENGIHGSDNMESNYKGMRKELVGLLAQDISRNICIDATCI